MIYRIAEPKDRLWLMSKGFKKFGFPTIVADDGELKGAIATSDDRDFIEAHRIWASSPFIAKNLIQAYENTLLAFSIDRYVFTVKEDTEWANMVDKSSACHIISQEGDLITYERSLNGR